MNIPNEALFFISIAVSLSALLGMYKLFGKNGLYVFSVFGTLLGNIAVCKSVDIFGLSATAGNVLYAASFLVTDILSEKYGKKDARKAVAYSFSVMLLWLAGTQAILRFTPNESDFVNESLKVIFGLAPRVTLASLAGYACSQTLDVFLYHFIWDKTGGSRKGLWIRNNGSTLTSQAIDTIIFTFLAFWGVFPTDVFFSILLTTYLFKAIVALCDTPFIYLARKIVPLDEKAEKKERKN